MAEGHLFPHEQANSPVFNAGFESGILLTEKHGKIGIIDREARGIKFRHTEFPGLRIQNSVLAQGGGNSTMVTMRNQKPRSQRASSPSKGNKYANNHGTSNVRNFVWFSNEVMRSAVQDAIMRKREFTSTPNVDVGSSTAKPKGQSPAFN